MQVDNLHEEIVFDKSTRRNGCFFTAKTIPAQVTLVGQNPSCAGVTRLVRAGCGCLHKSRFTLPDGQPDDWFTFQFRRRT